jgi:hypothetical protein
MGLFSRNKKTQQDAVVSRNSEDTLTPTYQKSRPTFLRIFVAFIYLIALVFIILVEIGNLNGKSVIRDTYFLNINISDIVPTTVPNASLLNSLAQSIGLHDFYQVGLWGYCEGYNDAGITYCSPPKTLYWFNPVEIILSELLAGASITLPEEIISILKIVKTASQWMFGLFMTGAVLTLLSIFLAPMAFSSKPRWEHKRKRIFFRSFPIVFLTFFAFLCTAAASVVATVMFVIFTNVLNNDAADLNIVPTLGVQMLAFEWTATGLLLLGLLMQLGTCCGICCCNGRKKAMKKGQIPVVEK